MQNPGQNVSPSQKEKRDVSLKKSQQAEPASISRQDTFTVPAARESISPLVTQQDTFIMPVVRETSLPSVTQQDTLIMPAINRPVVPSIQPQSSQALSAGSQSVSLSGIDQETMTTPAIREPDSSAKTSDSSFTTRSRDCSRQSERAGTRGLVSYPAPESAETTKQASGMDFSHSPHSGAGRLPHGICQRCISPNVDRSGYLSLARFFSSLFPYVPARSFAHRVTHRAHYSALFRWSVHLSGSANSQPTPLYFC